MIYNVKPIPSIPSVKPSGEVQQKQGVRSTSSFEDILNKKLNNDVKISKHAQMRMQARNVNLSEQQQLKLSQAVDKANAKGVNDTLVVMDKMAFVVNVKNRTVITALNSGDMKDNVFTNIDGAVFTD
ncbi:MAG TPA: TIGR02530 family flagellar biosynthesis protein [Thermoclostridium sp.]|nr:TIGR02530 family flagellar biosynthesis protein [Thermoclostridium sp.]